MQAANPSCVTFDEFDRIDADPGKMSSVRAERDEVGIGEAEDFFDLVFCLDPRSDVRVQTRNHVGLQHQRADLV